MIKKLKGFTLIELLSVIVVVGILIVVAFPMINDSIKASKGKAYNTTIQNIKTSASMYSNEFPDKLRWFVSSDTSNQESNEEWTCVQIKKLIEKGYLKDTREKNSEIFVVNPTNDIETTVESFVELRRDKNTLGLIRDKMTLESNKCNGGYDTTDPSLNIDLTYEDGSPYLVKWTDKPIVQTITAYDANGISELQIKYSDTDTYHDIEVLNKTDDTWIAKLIQKEDIKGDTIKIKSIDYFGNEIEKSYQMYLDKTAPTCQIVLSGTKANDTNEWYISDVKVELKVDDISPIDYDLSVNDIITYNNASMTLTQVEDTPEKIYYAHIKDQSGLVNACQISVKKDSVKPTGLSMTSYSSTFIKNVSSPSALPPKNAKFGVSGGTTSCTCNGKTCSNLGSVSNGNQNVVCTAYGNNGLSMSVSKNIYVKNCDSSYPSCSCGNYVANECGGYKYCGDCPPPPPPEPTCECSGTSFKWYINTGDRTCQQKYGFGSTCDGCTCSRPQPACECSSDYQCYNIYNYNYSCNGCTCSKTSSSEPDCYRNSDCGYNEYCSGGSCYEDYDDDDTPTTPTVTVTQTVTQTVTRTASRTTTQSSGCPAGWISDGEGGCCTKPNVSPGQCHK